MKFEVCFTDKVTGATSPIDIITAAENYTAADYVKDCADYGDSEFYEMITDGEIKLYPVND